MSANNSQLVESIRGYFDNESELRAIFEATYTNLVVSKDHAHALDYLHTVVVEAYTGVTADNLRRIANAHRPAIRALTSVTSANVTAAQAAAERLLNDIAQNPPPQSNSSQPKK